MKAIITLHQTKYILASCLVNKIPFDQVPITYSVQILQPGSFLPGIYRPKRESKVDFSFWWKHFAIGNFINHVSDWPIFLYIADNERVTDEQKCHSSFFYKLLNLFQS